MADGDYIHTPDSAIGILTDPEQFKTVLQAINEIQWMIANKNSPEEISQAIDEHYPYLSNLKRFLPNNFQDLVIAVGILYGIFNYFHPGTTPVQELKVQPDIAQALRDIADKLPDSPPSIRQDPPKPKQKASRVQLRRRGKGR
jgi:hypothetical protein